MTKTWKCIKCGREHDTFNDATRVTCGLCKGKMELVGKIKEEVI